MFADDSLSNLPGTLTDDDIITTTATDGGSAGNAGRSYQYNAWNKVATLTQGSNSTRFEYGPDRKRYLRVDQQGSTTTETLYVGEGYERVTTIDGSSTVEHKYHVHGIALITQTEGGNTETTHSLISDYQDSLLAIADQSGNLIQRFRYTPFGEQVDVSQGITGTHTFTTKGYTSHEHIEGMDIIHMNGRIYDPVIGRMVQSDPIVQAPTMVLSYNRYSYVWNNPMNRIDPTGYQGVGGEESEDQDSKDTAATNATDAAVSGQDPYATATVRRDANGVVYGEDIPTQELTIAKDPEPPGDRGVGLDNQTVNGDFSDVPNLDDFCGGCNNAPDTFADDLEDFGEGLLHMAQGINPAGTGAVISIGGKLAAIFAIVRAKAPATVELFRAVGIRELDSIIKNKAFLPGANSLEGRQFALRLDEALKFADTDLSKVAIIKATVNQNALKSFDFSKTIDPSIFRNGVVTVQPGKQSQILKNSTQSIEQVF